MSIFLLIVIIYLSSSGYKNGTADWESKMDISSTQSTTYRTTAIYSFPNIAQLYKYGLTTGSVQVSI